MKPSDQARWQGTVDSWLAQGSVDATVNGVEDGTVIVDTGQLTVGWYDFRIFLTAENNCYRGYIEHRNAVNGANINRFVVSFAKGSGPVFPVLNWRIADNERIRVITLGVSADRYYGGIYWVKRA